MPFFNEKRSGLAAADDAAGNFLAGISGGLSGVIVGIFVDNNGAVEDIFDLKTLVIKGVPGVTLIAKKREQISGMPGMRSGVGIIVFAGSGKIL